MKKYITLGAVAMSLLTTGCSNDLISENSPVDNSGKERIVLGAGDDQAAFQTRAGFTKKTRIVARYVSDSREGGAAKCVTTLLSAAAGTTGDNGYSKVNYVSGYTRYWDDAHGRNSRLSVYAVAIPDVYGDTDDTDASNLPSGILKGAETWATTNADDNTLTWTVTDAPEYDDLAAQDLTYSNNIQEGNVGGNSVYTWNYTSNAYPEEGPQNATKHTKVDGESSVTDGRMYFTQSADWSADVTDAPGHFDKGQMEFKHALTRIQVNLLKGDGYDGAAFDITDMQVLGQSITGKFDIKDASWSNKGTATPITMAEWTTAASRTDGKTNAATYEAQMLPDYTFTDNATNVLQLTVDGNTYYITNAQLRTALNGKVPVNDGVADYATKSGNRYIFDITVKKAEITNITATIVDWNDVTAEEFEIDNSHLTFKFYDNNKACDDVKLYKFEQGLENIVTTDATYAAAPVAGSAYTAVAGFTKPADKDYYTTSEYYKDNKTAYHFRSLNTTAASVLAADGKTFTMTSGNDDYHWGAPMLPTDLTAIPYSSETGYSATIAKGIIAADKESKINLTEIHMMSQLVIKLTTPETGGVDLTDAEVYLTKYSATGTVDMSLGKITPTTTITDMSSKFAAAASPATDTYVFNVVPQSLVRGSDDADYVGITIKTKDNNEYYIIKKLSDIIGTAGTEVTNKQENGKITTWYPGHRYTYTFNIKKKEIEVITATIVPWNDVTGANTDLDLEK